MIVYHTSSLIIEKPDVLHSRLKLDFGKGFYTTTLKQQAEDYGKRFTLRGMESFMNVYMWKNELVTNAKIFETYNEEWLDFIAACRRGIDINKPYDVIMGGVANDNIFNTVDLYFAGRISKDEALKVLIFEKPKHQICFTNQKVIDSTLTFIEAIPIVR